ncbi:MAG: hypothetical protein ACI4HI_05760 [Lachnospiraceae bacterium]
MQKISPSRPMTFLLELLVTILLFSIASAVCIQFFVKAHQISVQTEEWNHGIQICENAAEIFSSGDSSFDSLLKQYPNATLAENVFSLFYNKDFQPCDSQNANYYLEVIHAKEGDTAYADIFFRSIDTNSTIYRLHITHHIPRTVAADNFYN